MTFLFPDSPIVMRPLRVSRCLLLVLLAALVACGLLAPAGGLLRASRRYAAGGPYVAAGAATRAGLQPPYILDTGDRLRVSVFGQEGVSNSYLVDAAGYVNLALIGPVAARGLTAPALAQAIAARLREGYIREPHVSVEVEAYRPFYILGEVNAPGQYPYQPGMSVETAIAIAGGYSPRADKRNAHAHALHERRADQEQSAAADPAAPRRHRQCRRTVVLSVTASAAAQNPSRLPRAGRRTVPPRRRSRARSVGARPSGRHHRGQLDRRRERRSRLCRTRAPSCAWRKPRSDGPRISVFGDIAATRAVAAAIARLAPDVVHGHGAKGAAYARLAAVAAPCHPRLHAAWRQPALPARTRSRAALHHARENPEVPHRSVPVRKRIYPRAVQPPDRRAARDGQGRPQRRRRERIRGSRRRRRPRPISSTSANFAPSKASTF